MPKHIGEHHNKYLLDADNSSHKLNKNEKLVFSTREMNGVRKNGTQFPIQINVCKAIIDNEEMYIGTISDIAMLKAKEDQLLVAKLKADSANKAKSKFLASMSHELRTPLNGILGMAQLLDKTTLNEEQQDYLNIIQESSYNLLTIINDILDITKIESGQLVLEETEMDLEEIVKTTCAMFLQKAEEKSVKIVSSYEIDPGFSFLGDPTRLKQILINLFLGTSVIQTDRFAGRQELHAEPVSPRGEVGFDRSLVDESPPLAP